MCVSFKMSSHEYCQWQVTLARSHCHLVRANRSKTHTKRGTHMVLGCLVVCLCVCSLDVLCFFPHTADTWRVFASIPQPHLVFFYPSLTVRHSSEATHFSLWTVPAPRHCSPDHRTVTPCDTEPLLSRNLPNSVHAKHMQDVAVADSAKATYILMHFCFKMQKFYCIYTWPQHFFHNLEALRWRHLETLLTAMWMDKNLDVWKQITS